MNDTETQVTLGLVELAMLQHLKNVTSMREQLEEMVSTGRVATLTSVSKSGDLTVTHVSESELGGVS